MSKANVLNLPSHEEEAPIQEGDAVVIIKPDGTVKTMTVGIDSARIERVRAKAPEDMNDEELDLALQGQTLFLLSMAAQSEVIMDLLTKIAAQPGVIDEDKLMQIARPN